MVQRRQGSSDHEEFTLEERLLRMHELCALLADLFDLLAAAPDYLQGGALSASGWRALSESCRRSGADLRELLDRLPADVTNWTPTSKTRRRRTARR